MTTADLNFPGCRPLVPPSPQTHSPVRVKEDKKRELSSGLASASMTSPSPGKTWLFLLLSYFERSLERAFLAAGKACACEINRAAATAGLCYFLLCSFCIFHSGHLFSLSVREINESFLSKLFKSRLCCLQHFFRPLLILGSRVSHYSLCSPLSASVLCLQPVPVPLSVETRSSWQWLIGAKPGSLDASGFFSSYLEYLLLEILLLN